MVTGSSLDLGISHHVCEPVSAARPLCGIAVIPATVEVAQTPYMRPVVTCSPNLPVRDSDNVAHSLTCSPLTVAVRSSVAESSTSCSLP